MKLVIETMQNSTKYLLNMTTLTYHLSYIIKIFLDLYGQPETYYANFLLQLREMFFYQMSKFRDPKKVFCFSVSFCVK